jgi:hypothetical protein
MSAPRLATIPFEHVEAEMAAFPLASEASFRLGRTSLNPDVSNSDLLWRDAEKEIMEALPSVHLEEASAIRDRLWFHNTLDSNQILQPVRLVTYLQQLAASYLDERGRPIDLATSDSSSKEGVGSEARLRWCWMCRALPPDLLRSARGVIEGDEDPFPLHPVLLQVLRDQGFAETHLHQGSALDFSLVWAALMRDLTRSRISHSDFVSLGACFQGGRDLGTWLMQAAVVRLVLAKWLFDSQRSAPELSALLTFARYSAPPSTQLTDNKENDSRDAFGEYQSRKKRGQSFSEVAVKFLGRRFDVMEFDVLASLLSDVLNGKLSDPRPSGPFAKPEEVLNRRFARVRSLYLSLIGAPTLLPSRQADYRTLKALFQPEEGRNIFEDDPQDGAQLIKVKATTEKRSDIFANDPLALVVRWQPTMGGSPEGLFTNEALRHISENEENHDFARLFWQLTRIRCLLYRYLVERPLTPGLQWFMRFFSRIKPLRKRIPATVLFETAARLSGKDVGLRSLEVRLGTDENQTACLDTIRAVESAGASEELRNIEIGAVFHFSRKRGGGWEQGRLNAHGLDHSYPGTADRLDSTLRRTGSKLLKEAGNPSGFRFARFYIEQRRHAQALVNVLQMYPGLLRTIRGIDLCTDEAGVPVWVMAPLIRWVRESGQEASIQLKRRGNSAVPPLRTTVHAGEDFVHLMAGLRRIDHTVTYLRLEEGDRLGHALALGTDPLTWCDSTGRVVQTSEERLLDLVWEWGCYAKHNVNVESRRLEYVRAEITRLTTRVFAEACAPETMLTLIDQLHVEQRLHAEGFPDQPMLGVHRKRSNIGKDTESLEERLLKRYLCDEQVWRQGRVSEIVNFRAVEHEKAALVQLQNGLRRRLGALGLTIEVNPSSNVVIGDLGHLEVHPLWRLRPVIPDNDVPPLSICIGSDNPLILATTLPHEYQLLFDALVIRGESHEVAKKWLDEVRDAGMRARFTLPRRVAQIDQQLRPNILTAQRLEGPP